MVAGASGMIFFNPIELVKCRAQVNRQAFIKYTEEIPILISNEGALALYNGASAALMRDVPAWGMYFWTY